MAINRDLNASQVSHPQYLPDPRQATSTSRNNKAQEVSNTDMTSGDEGSSIIFLRKIFVFLFYLHLFLVTVLTIFLTVRGMISAANNKHRSFRPREWYSPILASTACGGIVALAWPAIVFRSPSRGIMAVLWLSPLLSLGVAILLIYIGTTGSSVAGALALISAFVQSLYSCWVNPRIEYAARVISISTSSSRASFNYSCMVLLSIAISTLYSSVAIAGIGGARATATRLDFVFIVAIILSFIWTLQVIKNTLQVTVSHIKYYEFAAAIQLDAKEVFLNYTAKNSMGTICFASILVPILTVIRGTARAVSQVSGDVDEFLFSCSSCSSGIASCLVAYGNRWGFLRVGVHNKGIVQASSETWEMFRRAGMEQLINSDLTASICFFCGIAGGAACSLLGGSWAFAMHKTYATEISLYAFLIGYLMSRVTMALLQACISAYYIAYAENPQSQRFDNTIIPAYIQRLQRYGA
ncbi:PREDICTED: protein PNS1-like isoform X2 [Ipomoea nil]|uniref:protein PNS1-like isoform X2 n=1 Tax=Ipomoea nil TaxID=35883 RepID=UPI0009014757|nr:PREDICTED: protein PNS1-like isoform X2 [Ipomoea nil]